MKLLSWDARGGIGLVEQGTLVTCPTPRALRTGLVVVAAALAVAAWPGGAVAGLDPETDKPYQLDVVLQVAPNRLLTPLFREQLKQDLSDGVRAALGPLGETRVVDLAEVPANQRKPLWQEVAARGLQAGLDGPVKGLSGVKTHFLRVDYVNGLYEVEGRQHDGLTGVVSPLRRERTPDRQFVGRAAGLMLAQDFGLVGTVMDGKSPEKVKVAWRGAGLKVPLDRFVKKGDVLALVQVSGSGEESRAFRVPWTVLRVEEGPGANGTSVCRLFQSRARPLAEGGTTAGYRCIKLGTVTAPLRIRLTRASAAVPTPAASLEVHVRRQGFTGEEDRKVQGASDADGYFTTERVGERDYQGLAFVSVLAGGGVRAQIPVALVDERVVTCPVPVSNDAAAQLALRRTLWEQGLLDEQLFLNGLFKGLNQELGVPKNREATLARARQGLAELDRGLERYGRERAELASGTKGTELAVGDGRLSDLRRGRGELVGFIAGVEKILKEENDPVRQEARTQHEQAKLLEETEAEYGKAIELYRKVLEVAEDAKLRERVKRLEEAWKPRDGAHKAARGVLYETWPKLDGEQVKARLGEVARAVEECMKVKDPLGPRRFLRVAGDQVARLSKQLESLQPDTREEDRGPAQELADTLERLAKLIDAAQAFVKETPAP